MRKKARRMEEKDRDMDINGIATIVFPARDLPTALSAWRSVTGTEPLFETPDYAAFAFSGVEIGLTRLPWVDFPLVMLDVDDIDVARQDLLAAGATAMAEVEGGGLAELGTQPVTNGNPDTGIVDMNGARLAVVRIADGSLLGLRQATEWVGA
jgi:hypothetical protein